MLAAALAVAALLPAVSGGIRANVGGFRVSAQSPWPTVALSVISLGAWAFHAWRARALNADLELVWTLINRRASTIIIAVALASGGAAAVFATNSASGADASGYLSQAAMWSQRHLVVFDRLGAELMAALPMDIYPTTPLGWRARDAGTQVPSYPPGLPLLMALPHRIAGTRGAALLIPLSAFIAVWTVGALSRTLAGGAAGVVAAILMAVTPVFLFQSVQPMSDVPVTAAWMVCWWLIMKDPGTGSREPGTGNRSPLWAGIACAVAILIRPNLAPLAVVPFLAARGSRIRFAIPVVAAGLFLALMQWYWYGSPLRTGYGTTEELFALSNVPLNLSHYLGWLADTSPVLVAAVGGFWIVRARRDARAMLVFAVLVVAAYLAYAVFEDWSYLRFLLPAMAVAAVSGGVLCQSLIDRLTPAARPLVLFALVLVVMAHGLVEARARDTFKLAGQMRRVVEIAASLGDRMTPSDVIVAGEQSGSMRYYTAHDIVRWEELRAEDWDRVFAALADMDRAPWIVLDAFEEPLFRSKFGAHPAGVLDWPPAIDAGDTHRTRAWRLADRARFVAGENVATVRLR